MAQDVLERLTDQIRKDPALVHRMLFEPEKALESLDYLSSDAKEAVKAAGLRPERFVGGLVGIAAKDCGVTCGGSSCQDTCGSVSCNKTCEDSCTNTCKNSCGGTVGVVVARI